MYILNLQNGGDGIGIEVPKVHMSLHQRIHTRISTPKGKNPTTIYGYQQHSTTVNSYQQLLSQALSHAPQRWKVCNATQARPSFLDVLLCENHKIQICTLESYGIILNHWIYISDHICICLCKVQSCAVHGVSAGIISNMLRFNLPRASWCAGQSELAVPSKKMTKKKQGKFKTRK